MTKLEPRQHRPKAHDFYRHALDLLQAAGIPFLVGGAYAVARYTGISRFTKDFDLFVLAEDRDWALAELRHGGYAAEVTYEHWLAKARNGKLFVDIIYGAGNGVTGVDQAWFDHALAGEVLGATVSLVPAEELIWSKAFIMERERYDGADVLHLIRARAEQLDWDRLSARFDSNWRVLLSHLVLFGFVYPTERDRIPGRVMDDLLGRLEIERGLQPPAERYCRGTLLSREQYLADITEWGYHDARLAPRGKMTPEQAERWTAAIHEERP